MKFRVALSAVGFIIGLAAVAMGVIGWASHSPGTQPIWIAGVVTMALCVAIATGKVPHDPFQSAYESGAAGMRGRQRYFKRIALLTAIPYLGVLAVIAVGGGERGSIQIWVGVGLVFGFFEWASYRSLGRLAKRMERDSRPTQVEK